MFFDPFHATSPSEALLKYRDGLKAALASNDQDLKSAHERVQTLQGEREVIKGQIRAFDVAIGSLQPNGAVVPGV